MYIIMKDDLYLMNILNMGIRELTSNNTYEEVPTAIYSADIRDAKVFDSNYMAKIVGGIAIKVNAKGSVKK